MGKQEYHIRLKEHVVFILFNLITNGLFMKTFLSLRKICDYYKTLRPFEKSRLFGNNLKI